MKNTQRLKFEVVQESRDNWLFEQRETQKRHSPYAWELLFFECIRDGNISRLDQLIQDVSQSQLFVGKLSWDNLRQSQYLAVAFITLATRYAIQGGMFEMDAYNKSDAFIQKVDQQVNADDVGQLLIATMRSLTEEMQTLQIRKTYSLPIKICLDVIYQNLHSNMSLKMLSARCNLSGPYLSSRFKKEVGINLSAYIMKQKIKAAQSMMLHSLMSVKEISNYLEFSSQSYFINCFKRECGITPNVYIRQNLYNF